MPWFVVTLMRDVARISAVRIFFVMAILGVGALMVSYSSPYSAETLRLEQAKRQQRAVAQRLQSEQMARERDRLAAREAARRAKRRLKDSMVNVNGPIPREVLSRYTDIEKFKLHKTPDLAIDVVVVRRAPPPPSSPAHTHTPRIEALLCHRRDNGRLAIPGGFVDYGESPEEAALRELREETGLDAADWLRGDDAIGAARPMRVGPVPALDDTVVFHGPPNVVKRDDDVKEISEDTPPQGTNKSNPTRDADPKSQQYLNYLPGAQLIGVYGHPFRDRRRHTVSIAYLLDLQYAPTTLRALTPKAGDDAKSCAYYSLANTLHRWRNQEIILAFDHGLVLQDVQATLKRVTPQN